MFRSARFYSFSSDWPTSEEELSNKLFGAAFTPCGPYTEQSFGWEPPVGDSYGVLARRVGGADLLRLRSQTRILPMAAVNEALEERLAEYRARTQEEPSRKTRRTLKDQTRDELLPKALLKSQRTIGLCIPAERILAIGSASETRAEQFLEKLRAALGKLDVKPLEFKRPFTDFLNHAFAGETPAEFNLGTECRMRDPKDRKGVVSWQAVDLDHAAVRKCAKDGMELTHLGVEFGNVLGAVVDTNGVLTKLKLLGLDDPPQDGDDDPIARFDAELALLGGTLRQLVAGFGTVLGPA